jgi:hypothetical protein
MAARKCPNCLTSVGAGAPLAFTDSIDCPGCRKKLEVSAGSRYLATCFGILAAVAAWFASQPGGLGGLQLPGTQPGGAYAFFLPVVYVFLSFSVAAPLLLMLIADLRLKPDEPEPEALPASGAHGHGHH